MYKHIIRDFPVTWHIIDLLMKGSLKQKCFIRTQQPPYKARMFYKSRILNIVLTMTLHSTISNGNHFMECCECEHELMTQIAQHECVGK